MRSLGIAFETALQRKTVGRKKVRWRCRIILETISRNFFNDESLTTIGSKHLDSFDYLTSTRMKYAHLMTNYELLTDDIRDGIAFNVEVLSVNIAPQYAIVTPK